MIYEHTVAWTWSDFLSMLNHFFNVMHEWFKKVLMQKTLQVALEIESPLE